MTDGADRNSHSMLEDPSHQDVARWGKDGDSFVVVEVRHTCLVNRPPTPSGPSGVSRLTVFLLRHRARNSPDLFFLNTSNTATCPVLFGN